MRSVLLLLLLAAAGCSSRETRYVPAENALDAGREFIGACLNGDFLKAGHYLLPDDANREKLAMTEAFYRQKDKEGRQQYRQASINLKEVKEISADTTLIYYSNSFDRTPDSLRVIRSQGQWLVDIAHR